MYMSCISVVGVLSQTHIKWRWKEPGVKTKNIYSVFEVVTYKQGWVGDTDVMGGKCWVRGNDNGKATKLEGHGGNRQQEMGGEGGEQTHT